MLIRVVHHGDEHVQEDHQGDYVVCAEHCGAHKLREGVVGFDIGHVQVDEPKYGPE